MKQNQLTEFNEGGSHEENIHGGIPLGNNNRVEQGETKKENYIYSDRLSIDEDMVQNMSLPGYIKNKTFADASKAINNKFKDRNDKYSNETKNTLLERLTNAQEALKMRELIKTNAINSSLFANSQDVPDQMNGEIPEGMEEFAEGGYYDSNNPYFATNPGEQTIAGPKNGTFLQRNFGFANNFMGGLGVANSLQKGDTTGALMGGAQIAAEKGLLGAGASNVLGSITPGLGALEGGFALNELSKGVGASRSKVGSAATGALTGAMAGAGFGPAGIIAGGTIGAIAGGIGSGKRRKQDAELGSTNARMANNVFRDKEYNSFDGGGFLPINPFKKVASNVYNAFNPIEGTLTNEDFTNDLVSKRNALLSGSYGATTPITQPNYYDNNKPFFTTDVMNPAKTSTTKTPFSFDGIKDKVGGLLRYSPVAMNALQLAKLRKPGQVQLERLTNRYKPGYLDEASLQNTIANENANTVNALTNASGGSEAALRAGLLASNVGRLKARSDAYSQMRQYNNAQDAVAQNFNLGVDQTNLQQANLQQDINDRNLGNYDTQKSKLLGQIGTDLGSIGKEEVFKRLAKNMTGYTWDGNYVVNTTTGQKHTLEDFAKLNNTTPKQSKYGGFLNKKGRS